MRARARTASAPSIAVRDNGVGIAPEALPRIFEMFSRGDRASARGQGGLGIGLALARRLAEMHGGTLEARSEGLGQGSEFTVRLPLAEPAPAAAVRRTSRARRVRPRSSASWWSTTTAMPPTASA